MRLRKRRLGLLGLALFSLWPTDDVTAADWMGLAGGVPVPAALGVLPIGQDIQAGISIIDWIVIVAYALGMIGVGWYCSRRATTTEDYMLGGRAMKPWAVGLSLFATLFSTLTYLAIPGEMIMHGPMIAAQIVIFPLIILVVGWVLIPRIMKFKVTSAYEILETRLGIGVRMLAASFFLGMRLLWMSLIIYVTTSQVLVPLLGWDESATPYICAVLGIVTVIYTSMGGLRAVVITDVVQTFILLGGAALTIVLITVDLGGVGAWWPTQWDPAWDPPKIWFDPDARMTVAMASLFAFTWYICTAGSDQMAIQRFLATRDVKAARSMYSTSLFINALVMVFLSILGLALLAWFQANPNMLVEGQTIATSADNLLPRFIVIGLPNGVSGLIVAALLAAAMSSLSSGINSSCLVITVDFVERFRAADRPQTDHVRLAKYISWLLGIVVVGLSFGVGMVSGNLLEVTYKLLTLPVAPLFVLFYMAMFVPWSTPFGTIVAATVSMAVAIGIGFFEFMGLGFIWIIPVSLIVGIVVGMLASLVPVGQTTRGRPNG
jgi:SSS family solute:Na+ symporter